MSLVHSVDSVRLLENIDRVAGELGLRPRVLIEVNLTGDPNKHGFSQDELLRDWLHLIAVQHLQVQGLMTMAAYSPNPDDARPTFANLRTLRDRLAERSPPEVRLTELSMGMTGDFEVATPTGKSKETPCELPRKVR